MFFLFFIESAFFSEVLLLLPHVTFSTTVCYSAVQTSNTNMQYSITEVPESGLFIIICKKQERGRDRVKRREKHTQKSSWGYQTK